MFGLRKISAYDEQYLNQKKQILEDLLNIKNRLEEACSKYDEESSLIKASYEATKKADYISMVTRRDREINLQRPSNEIINEALKLQNSDLKYIAEKLRRRMKYLFSSNNPLYQNIMQIEETKYYHARALYKEINMISFIKDLDYLEGYLMNLNLIYSAFMANEYSKLNQAR